MANNYQAQPFQANSDPIKTRLVLDLCEPDRRENAMILLYQKRRHLDLAPLLWNTNGTVDALIKEIIAIYPLLSPPTLSAAQSNRVCYALVLLQCLAYHPYTRMLFLKAHLPLYLYPFLNATSTSNPFENLKLTTLGVIGALVKAGDTTEAISFLLSAKIIPQCLITMERGSEISKTVATFIVHKILLADVGLNYICATSERYSAVAGVLDNMVAALAVQPSSRPLKYIIGCYLRLSENPEACNSLRRGLPDMLRDGTFNSRIRVREDRTTQRCLEILLNKVLGQ